MTTLTYFEKYVSRRTEKTSLRNKSLILQRSQQKHSLHVWSYLGEEAATVHTGNMTIWVSVLCQCWGGTERCAAGCCPWCWHIWIQLCYSGQGCYVICFVSLFVNWIEQKQLDRLPPETVEECVVSQETKDQRVDLWFSFHCFQQCKIGLLWCFRWYLYFLLFKSGMLRELIFMSSVIWFISR